MEEKRTPGICKIAVDRGNIVDGAPPRHPKVHQAEYIWSMIKAGYGTRYGAFGVVEDVRGFCGEISAVDLFNISGLCDKVASIMAGEESALFLDDNDVVHGAGCGDSDSGEGGAMPAN